MRKKTANGRLTRPAMAGLRFGRCFFVLGETAFSAAPNLQGAMKEDS